MEFWNFAAEDSEFLNSGRGDRVQGSMVSGLQVGVQGLRLGGRGLKAFSVKVPLSIQVCYEHQCPYTKDPEQRIGAFRV